MRITSALKISMLCCFLDNAQHHPYLSYCSLPFSTSNVCVYEHDRDLYIFFFFYIYMYDSVSTGLGAPALLLNDAIR